MRRLIACFLLFACSGDSLIDELRADESYCPDEYEVIRPTLRELVCDRLMRCGDLEYESVEECEESGFVWDSLGTPPQCIDGCTMREVLLWYDDRRDSCDDGLEPPMNPWVCR